MHTCLQKNNWADRGLKWDFISILWLWPLKRWLVVVYLPMLLNEGEAKAMYFFHRSQRQTFIKATDKRTYLSKEMHLYHPPCKVLYFKIQQIRRPHSAKRSLRICGGLYVILSLFILFNPPILKLTFSHSRSCKFKQVLNRAESAGHLEATKNACV